MTNTSIQKITGRLDTCVGILFDAFRNPIRSFPSGSMRLNVTVGVGIEHMTKEHHIILNFQYKGKKKSKRKEYFSIHKKARDPS